jgi:hypothetical protein
LVLMSSAEQPAPAGSLPRASTVVEFYIPATSSLQERRPRTLKHADTFGVFDHYGNIVPGEGSPEASITRTCVFSPACSC